MLTYFSYFIIVAQMCSRSISCLHLHDRGQQAWAQRQSASVAKIASSKPNRARSMSRPAYQAQTPLPLSDTEALAVVASTLNDCIEHVARSPNRAVSSWLTAHQKYNAYCAGEQRAYCVTLPLRPHGLLLRIKQVYTEGVGNEVL
jgi:hypothetical protein